MVQKKTQKISVQGLQITTLHQDIGDYISLTDMARYKNPEHTGIIIAHWLSTKYTLQFIGAWETMFNPDFNVTEFGNIRNEAGSNIFILSVSNWITKTKSIGIRSSVGRYGGTFAHKDIAFEFATWLSPEFKLYLIREFQRLKEDEGHRLDQHWNIRRTLAKINYKIQTDAVKEHLVPAHLRKDQITHIYASEADVLNVALFGMTAKEWRGIHPKEEGNIRDVADLIQLVVLSNLESLNAELIRQELPQGERLLRLNQIAITQMTSLLGSQSIKKLNQIEF